MDISSTFQSHQFESIKKFLFEIDSFWCQPISHKWSFCFSNNANNSHLSEVISWNSLRFWIRVSNYDINHRWRNVWWLFFSIHTQIWGAHACFMLVFNKHINVYIHWDYTLGERQRWAQSIMKNCKTTRETATLTCVYAVISREMTKQTTKHVIPSNVLNVNVFVRCLCLHSYVCLPSIHTKAPQSKIEFSFVFPRLLVSAIFQFICLSDKSNNSTENKSTDFLTTSIHCF